MQNTNQWTFFAWASWVGSVMMMVIGIWHLPVEIWIQGYLAMSSFFLMSSTFTLSKTIRDNHERTQTPSTESTPEISFRRAA